ncbi:MAG: hypothetical protein F6J97_10560 [Leptolyngbya sp. SIO4C1]|nr:hypothetical protein [Leptolyngbya sp. SIO4C1]
MSFAILIVTIVVSYVLCSFVDGLPNLPTAATGWLGWLSLGWLSLPKWFFLAACLGGLAWLTGDR